MKKIETGEYTGDSSRLEIYAPFELTTDISTLSASQKKMLPLLINAAKIMDTLFWMQSYGEPEPLLIAIESEKVREFARINYGPWDRLADNAPFLSAFSEKPAGARFYPSDMTRAEFEAAELEGKDDPYTLVRRD
ncbi:MAG TPA: hypothetical protein VKZ54_03670, partial [Membranihabitans sp.]|nr:hypothetical protein [Membranihabitans sp.]